MNNNNINDINNKHQQQPPPSKILLALYLWTVISLLLLGGVLLLPGCGSGNNQQLPSGATITVSSCNAQIVDTLSKMTTPSFSNNGLGVPDAITHYPNIVTTGESEVSYTWIGAKTTILFQWNVESGSCIQQTSKG